MVNLRSRGGWGHCVQSKGWTSGHAVALATFLEPFACTFSLVRLQLAQTGGCPAETSHGQSLVAADR